MPSAAPRARRWTLLAGGAVLLTLAFVLGQRACREEGAIPRTIVLFTIDTWRRDHAGFLAPGWPEGPSLMPRIDALARHALRFGDARTPVPLTLPAHVTMLSGLPPAATGVRTNAFGRIPGPEARGFPLLAEGLAAAGWRTGAFVSAEPLAADHGLGQGFEVYDDASEAPAGEVEDLLQERPGGLTVARALAWLGGLPGEVPAFLWVHVFEPHMPYESLTYAGDVRQADAVAGALLDGLEAAGRGDAALLVTSDHGEMLDELGERTHGHLLADAVLRVPFLLRAPRLAPALRDDPVDLADVAPTLAGLAGIPWQRGPGAFAGRDLLAGAAPPNRVRVAESLYAHQRFRWAQLVAATDAHGTVLEVGTLIDAGEGRAGLLKEAPHGRPQSPPLWIAQGPSAALQEALADYKRGEVKERMLPGGYAAGYATSGRVAAFLPSNENAALLNPYDEVQMRRLEFADRARGVLKVLRRRPNPRLLEGLAPQIEEQRAQDPRNPDLLFLAGLAAECRAVEEAHSPAPVPATIAALSARAEDLYGQAFQAGREDADTLFRWVGVNALGGRERLCLGRLTEMGKLPWVVWNAALWTLKADLHRALEEVGEAEAACGQARKAARKARERADVEKHCGGR